MTCVQLNGPDGPTEPNFFYPISQNIYEKYIMIRELKHEEKNPFSILTKNNKRK